MRRWFVRLGIGAVVVVVILIAAAKLLLRSGFAADKVAAELQAAAGSPVHVGSLDVGLSGSNVRDLQFLEEGAPKETPPWVEIAEVEADVSLPSLIRGDLPGGSVTLHRPRLTFRFDRNDKLLTKLPSPEGPTRAWPAFHIADGQIRFEREGSPASVFSGINGTLEKTGDHITLQGTTDDPEWGKWTITGGQTDAAAPFLLMLHSDSVRVTPGKLRRVPFVPAVIWEEVSLDGRTPVDLTLQFGGSQSGPAIRYRVALAPTKTTVKVSAIDLTANGTSGKAVVEDGVVTLSDVTGAVAGGTLRVANSVLDFRGDGSEQHYTVSGERLNLRELPHKWGLPAWDGRLSGQANLTISTRNGQTRTSGGGAGVIEGFLSQKLDVKLTANKHGFQFDVSNAPGAMRRFLFGLIAANLPALQPSAPRAEKPPGQTIRINLGLTDVKLSELIQKLNLKLPISIDGKLTFHVQATIPLSDGKDLKKYQATGTVELPWLRIEDLWLQQVKARVTLDNGLLRLDEVSAREPNSPLTAPPTALLPGGALTGTASLNIAPLGDLSANLKAVAMPIGPILKLIPGGDANAAGTIDCEMQFRAPAGTFRDIQKWTGSGKFSGKNIRLQSLPADRFTGSVVLHGGSMEYSVKGEALGGAFDINGRYPSPPDNEPDSLGKITISNIDLARFAGAMRIDALKPLAGRFDLNATLSNDLSGTGQVTLTSLAWAGKPVANRLGGTILVSDGTIRVNDLSGRLAGGSVHIRLNYDMRRPDRSHASLTAQRLDGRTFTAPFTDTPPLDGPLELQLFTHFGREWSGTGQVAMGYGKLFGVTVREARFPLGWDIAPGRRGELRLHDAMAQVSRGRLTGQANLSWGEAARLDGQFHFIGLDVGELLSHYSQTKVIGGLASGRIDLGGQNMHSAQDLTARIQAKLSQANPGQMPVFRQIMPMIRPGIGSNMTFQSGDVRGQLSRGVFRVERLTLVGDLARVYAEGTVTIQRRLNFNVVANTSQLGIDPAVLQLLGVALPAFGPIPLGTLNQAVSYLSNRTVSLRVTGTIKSPSVRVNPAPFLTESAVRFFITQAGVPIPSAALQTPGP